MVAGRLFGSPDRANLENSVLDIGRLPDPCKGLKAASEASMVNEPRQRAGDHGQARSSLLAASNALDLQEGQMRHPLILENLRDLGDWGMNSLRCVASSDRM